MQENKVNVQSLQPLEPQKTKENIKEMMIEGRFKPCRRIGYGSFGEIYLSHDLENNKEVAIKFEAKDHKHQQLFKEASIYKLCQGAIGVPKIYTKGETQSYRFMVMELLASSLEDLFNFCNRKFSVKTTMMLAEQMICRIEFLHSKSYIHRDIKPDNFLIGRKEKSGTVYLVDLGLCKKYRSIKNETHIPFKENKSLTGTARYVSLNTHLGIEQSRRDDLEGLGYVLIYFLKGSLPWQGITAQTKKEKYWRIGEKKGAIPLELLCRDLPPEILWYMQECRALRFEEQPKYTEMRNKILDVFVDQEFTYDFQFD